MKFQNYIMGTIDKLGYLQYLLIVYVKTNKLCYTTKYFDVFI